MNTDLIRKNPSDPCNPWLIYLLEHEAAAQADNPQQHQRQRQQNQ